MKNSKKSLIRKWPELLAKTSHTTGNAKNRSLKISDYFSKQNGKPSLSGE